MPTFYATRSWRPWVYLSSPMSIAAIQIARKWPRTRSYVSSIAVLRIFVLTSHTGHGTVQEEDEEVMVKPVRCCLRSVCSNTYLSSRSCAAHLFPPKHWTFG